MKNIIIAGLFVLQTCVAFGSQANVNIVEFVMPDGARIFVAVPAPAKKAQESKK